MMCCNISRNMKVRIKPWQNMKNSLWQRSMSLRERCQGHRRRSPQGNQVQTREGRILRRRADENRRSRSGAQILYRSLLR